jgi:thioredoxin-like negative regulator of GroEL
LEKAPKNLEKRLKVADIYAEVGDWSKVEYHLLQCYRQKEHDTRILEKLVVLYKEKRDNKMAAKYEKKLSLLKASHKKQPN